MLIVKHGVEIRNPYVVSCSVRTKDGSNPNIRQLPSVRLSLLFPSPCMLLLCDLEYLYDLPLLVIPTTQSVEAFNKDYERWRTIRTRTH